MNIIHKIFIPALLAWLLALCYGCADDTPTLPGGDKMPLVVEGWIEDGGYPIVLVTRAADMSAEIKDFDAFVQRWCRVSIDDGDKRYWLTGRIDRKYTPPLIYTTNELKGEVGKTYRLTVETDMDTVWAQSTLLPYAKIDSLVVNKIASNDTLWQIRAYADIEKDMKYKFFVRVRAENDRFYSSMFGTFDGADYDPSTGYDVRRGKHINYDDATFEPYFKQGEVVNVKLCSLDSAAYEFWTAYENCVSLSSNFLYSFTNGCPSNIVGGRGYWAAYGTSMANIKIK